MLLLGGEGDLLRDIAGGGGTFHYLVKHLHGALRVVQPLADTLGSLLGGHYQTADRFHDLRDFPPGFVGRFHHAVGQMADLHRHHPEPFSGLTGAGSLQRRIEGDQFGLIGDVADDVHDLGDLFRLASQFQDLPKAGLVVVADVAHLHGERFNTGRAVLGVLQGPVGDIHHLVAMIGDLARRQGKLLHGGGNLLHRSGELAGKLGLLFHAGRQVLGKGDDLAGHGGERDDDSAQILGHDIEHARRFAQFIPGQLRFLHGRVAAGDLDGQIAPGNGLYRFQHATKRLSYASGNQRGAADGKQKRNNGDHHQPDDGGLVAPLGPSIAVSGILLVIGGSLVHRIEERLDQRFRFRRQNPARLLGFRLQSEFQRLVVGGYQHLERRFYFFDEDFSLFGLFQLLKLFKGFPIFSALRFDVLLLLAPEILVFYGYHQKYRANDILNRVCRGKTCLRLGKTYIGQSIDLLPHVAELQVRKGGHNANDHHHACERDCQPNADLEVFH